MFKPSACVALVFLLYGLDRSKACLNHTITNGEVNISSNIANYSCNEGYEISGNSIRSCVNTTWAGDPPTCNIINCSNIVVENGNLSTSESTFNTTVTVTCHTGYQLAGNNPLLCLANKTWNYDIPTCSIINCSSLGTPANGNKDTEAVSYGTVVNFTCKTGYELEGDATLICAATGNWNGSEPKCNLTKCNNLATPANGRKSTNQTSYGTNVTFDCDNGFDLQGTHSVICEEDGSWSGSPPTCQIKSCSALPNPPNGTKDTNDTSYGTNVTFTCNEGYILNGTTWVTCEADGNWSNEAPSCEVKHCNPLDAPDNGFKNTNETTYGTKVTFNCRVGYELSGNDTATCLANAVWDSDVPTCLVLECPPLTTLMNGSKSTSAVEYNTTVLFDCEAGFDLVGSNSTSCLEDKSWSAEVPMCRIKDCGYLGDLSNGMKSTEETTYTTSVTIMCNIGYKLERGKSSIITCQANGNWSSQIPTCNIKQCDPLQKPTNGTVKVKDRNYGTTAYFECENGFDLIGDKQRTCTDREVWSGPETRCQIKKCSVVTAPQNGLKHTEDIKYQTVVQFSCNEGYILTGDETITCQASGNWSHQAPICQEDAETSNAAAAVAGVLSALLIIAVIAAAIFSWRRKKLCFSKSWNTSLRPIPDFLTRPGSRRQTLFRPGAIQLPVFPAHVETMHRDSNLLFADAFTSIRDNSFKGETKISTKKGNEGKNRYTDVLAYDHSRVKLFPGVEDHEHDYINANYIPGYTSPRSYIATQGPMESTAEDFWRMVWEQYVGTIVMLTKLVEKNMTKCDKYWPDLYESIEFGDFVVESKAEKEFDNYIDRLFLITLDDEIRNVRQFAYTTWPDMGCPEDPESLLDFVQTVRTEHNKSSSLVKGPMVVHCSAGVGRTGTFIAVDHLIQLVQNHDSVDIYEMVLDMRRHRCRMVQTEDQFVFIYDCLNAFISNDDEEYVEDDEEEEDEIAANGKTEPLYQNATVAAKEKEKEVLYQNNKAFQMDE